MHPCCFFFPQLGVEKTGVRVGSTPQFALFSSQSALRGFQMLRTCALEESDGGVKLVWQEVEFS